LRRAASRQRNEGAFVRRAPGILRAVEDRREEWLYDDGSAYFTRYFLTNSHVTVPTGCRDSCHGQSFFGSAAWIASSS
jgi:hypothetical protein